ncbi:hypothetical protein OUZ56_002272 [Daphnia magna]|uniref:Sm domain-containing protein n=2 Tax=Daphnia magna TaxID=35525 RepID=A0ABR0A552_9CRUS|nr:hypothetical protein OUZ56_002272 [Daphnia magna]
MNVASLPGTATLLEDLDKKVIVVLRDGRTLIGYLRSVDQFANLVLHRTIERIHVGKEYGDIPRGVFIVRGENVALLGEIDLEKEERIPLTQVGVEDILEAQRLEQEEKQAKEKASVLQLAQIKLAYIKIEVLSSLLLPDIVMILKTAGILSRRFLFTTAATKMSSTAKKLDGRIAIVTASTEGIGFAIAKRLASDGAQVVVSSRKQKNVDAAVAKLKMEGLSVTGMVCHVGLKEDREKLIEQTVSLFGGLDILISNAAVNPVFGPVLSCPEDAWDKIFDINVKTAFLLAKSAVPHMEKRGRGSIIFISSIAGFQPFSALGAYSVSKTALLGLTKVLAQEVGHSGIRVNCIAPGVIQTKFSSMLVDNDAVRNKVLEGIPLQRIGQPEDMGGLASFLCSDDASFITGENIIAAGGAQSRL